MKKILIPLMLLCMQLSACSGSPQPAATPTATPSGEEPLAYELNEISGEMLISEALPEDARQVYDRLDHEKDPESGELNLIYQDGELTIELMRYAAGTTEDIEAYIAALFPGKAPGEKSLSLTTLAAVSGQTVSRARFETQEEDGVRQNDLALVRTEQWDLLLLLSSSENAWESESERVEKIMTTLAVRP